MKPNKLSLFFFFLMALQASIHSQIGSNKIVVFSEGLAIGNVHKYGREALYKDELLYAMITNNLKPAAGQLLSQNNSNASTSWTLIKGDSTGTFRSAALGSGYLYLVYNAEKSGKALLNVTGHSMLYFNGEPHAGDQYRYGWMGIPVQLKKGMNEIYIRASGMGRFAMVSARLLFPEKEVQLQTSDATLPFLVKGESKDQLWAGLVVRNSLNQALSTLRIEAELGGKVVTGWLDAILPMSLRKMKVALPVPDNIEKGSYRVHLKLYNNNKLLDTASVQLTAVNKGEHACYTFLSKIDGSVQYYAVAPQTTPSPNSSLFLSVHGAEVEAISQARAYQPKAEGPIVAPTNRRPRGFNWEDWGRMDALEVLHLAKEKYQPDPQRIYLTGHSMGGHGTWYLGATFAGQWAAIAPSAGYPTLADYGSHDGKVPTEAMSDMGKMLIRAASPGNTLQLAKNYKAAGVYIFHGDADETVSVDYARQMRKVLADFHADHSYYEYPGGSHWFSNESVDWKPIFDYFKWHKIPVDSMVNEFDFSTASVGISNQFHWMKILQQQKSFVYSRVNLKRDLKGASLKGKTENVERIAVDLKDFKSVTTLKIELDSQFLSVPVSNIQQLVLLNQGGKWMISEEEKSGREKGELRNGGFKEAFNHGMVFVYGTKGTAAENAWMVNKARYDAETWYYRANGSVQILSDQEFNSGSYWNSGVILYGNSTINSAAAALLSDCPIQVTSDKVVSGSKEWTGDDLGAYVEWPSKEGIHNAVALIGGSGLKGMKAAEANQYFTGGSGFPDYMIFKPEIMRSGESGVMAAGFYNNQWQKGNEFIER